MKIPLIVMGVILSAGTAFWWDSELAGMLGSRIGSQSFHCLINVGTGDCQQLWFAGLHATNQIAAGFFYLGIVMAVFGLFMGSQKYPDDGDEFIDRPNSPPHF